MAISKLRTAPVAALAALVLVLPACGDDDDAPDAAPAADAETGGDGEDTADSAATATTSAEATADEDDDDDVTVDELSDIPEECVEVMGDFLERIEPIVEDIDWENATLEDFEGISEEMDAEASAMDDEEISEECERFTTEDDSLAILKELAEDRAPGVLPFIEWQEQLMEDFSEISIPEISIPEISIPDISLPAISVPALSIPDAPEDCDSAIAYVEDAMEQYDKLTDMPLSEMSAFGAASTVITTDCSQDQISEFFQRPDLTEFMGA